MVVEWRRELWSFCKTHLWQKCLPVKPLCRNHACDYTLKRLVLRLTFGDINGQLSLRGPFVWFKTSIIFLERCLVRIWFEIFIPEDGRVPTWKFAQLIRRKIVFYIHIFGEFNQIMKQPATVLFFFIVPQWFAIRICWKFKQKIFGQKLKKKKARGFASSGSSFPCFFFSIFDQKKLFEISIYWVWKSSRNTKKDWKRFLLPCNLIECPENANVKCDFRRMSRANFRVRTLLLGVTPCWEICAPDIWIPTISAS